MSDETLTASAYWGQLSSWGVTKCHPGSSGGWICQTRDGEYTFIDDPLGMTTQERLAALSFIGMRLGEIP